ncbi:hypothetical protein [Methylomonas albis]|uniref:PEP-CTERM protein-sorting domain-containing protein n=1 Tax=Methylomonas albis TaxID=1854563 RepID=A0ABR9D6U2_9GAMM|nr:hypothetical protein [Methylomonas albis]MBD9357998.1 hypothetical protein [Methylomonas albis]
MENCNLKSAVAGVFTLVAIGLVLSPATASASQVSGNVYVTIDNAQMAAATIVPGYFPNGVILEQYFDSSFNQTYITASNAGSGGNVPNMLFSVNSNTSTITYANGPGLADNRTLQKTTMDANNTSVGQIGLTGAIRFRDALGATGNYNSSTDWDLQKVNGVWNVVSNDAGFGANTLFTLVNSVESVDGSGLLHLSGDLTWGTSVDGNYVGVMTYGDFFASSDPHHIFGHLELNPSAVPVPAAVWFFGSGLLGLLGMNRRKRVA